MIRVALADDHVMIRDGLAKLLKEQPDLRVTGEASTAAELFDLLRRSPTDVVILDVSMPGPGIIEVLRTLARDHRGVRALVLSMFPEAQYATRALRNGAAGYLTKDQSPELLVDALRKVARGGRFITPAYAEHLAGELSGDHDPAPHEALSDREFDVLRAIAAGHSMKQIAAQMRLSPKTVTTYRARLIEKMRVSSNAELVRYVIEHGLGER